MLRRQSYLRHALAGIASAGLVMACSPGTSAAASSGGPADPDVVLSEARDPEVKAAQAEARRTLSYFWAKWSAKPAGYDDFALKVGFQVRDGGVEHMWVYPIRRSGDRLLVRVANDPVYVADLKFGSEVEVALGDVTDWAYSRDGKLYGHFSTRALLKNASPETRAELDRMLAPNPLESDGR